jgi:N-glycosylase/DNA lyase
MLKYYIMVAYSVYCAIILCITYTMKGDFMGLHEQIVEQYEMYIEENQKFEEKGVKASATRARKALGEIGKLAKDRRKEIQDKKNEM